MCSYGFIQTQLSEIQKQISEIYSAVTKLFLNEQMNEENIEKTVALFNDYFQKIENKNNFREE